MQMVLQVPPFGTCPPSSQSNGHNINPDNTDNTITSVGDQFTSLSLQCLKGGLARTQHGSDDTSNMIKKKIIKDESSTVGNLFVMF